MTRINELKNLITNSDNYKELASLAQKKGNYIEFNVRSSYYMGTYQNPYNSGVITCSDPLYSPISLLYGGSGRVC
jgi:hypothetical protein